MKQQQNIICIKCSHQVWAMHNKKEFETQQQNTNNPTKKNTKDLNRFSPKQIYK